MLKRSLICLLTRYSICSKFGMPPKLARGRKKAAVGKIKSIDVPSKEMYINDHGEVKEIENSKFLVNYKQSIDDNQNNVSTDELVNGKSGVDNVSDNDSNKLKNKEKPLKRGRPKKAATESLNDIKQESEVAIMESIKNDTPNSVLNEKIKPDSEINIPNCESKLDCSGVPSKSVCPEKDFEKNSEDCSDDPKQQVPCSELYETDTPETGVSEGDDKSKPGAKEDISDDEKKLENKDIPLKGGQHRRVAKTSEGDLEDPEQEGNSGESPNCDVINANDSKTKSKTEVDSPDGKNKLEAKQVPLKRGRPRKVVKTLEESPDTPKFETGALSSELPKASAPDEDLSEDNDKTEPNSTENISEDKQNESKDRPLKRGRPKKTAKTSDKNLEQISDDKNKNDSEEMPSKRGRPKRNTAKNSENSQDEKLQDEIKVPAKRGKGTIAKSVKAASAFTKNGKQESEELSSVSNKRENESSADEGKKEAKILKVNLQRSASIEKMLEEQTKVTEKGGANTAKAGSKRTKEGDEDSQDDAKSSKISKKESKSKGQSKKDKMPDVTLLDFSNKSTSPTGQPWNLKISSWNVNGVRAWLEKDGLAYVTHEDPDIIVFQETKCSDKALPSEVNVEGYHSYWLAGDKDGYSGVGLLSKIEPISVKYGIGVEEHDNEGRVITAEYETFYLVTTYVPNSGRGLVRLDYRMQWDKDFLSYLKTLDEKKPVVLCGDLNVAHEEIDLANPKNNKRNAGFTKEERDGFSTLLSEGFIDSFRHLYPDVKGAYTFWTYMMNARAKNVGWRLDYFVLSEKFTDHLCDSVIRKDVFGSDHCPITLFLNV